MRENYSNELKSRTELEMLLRNSLDDIKREKALKTNQEEMNQIAFQIQEAYVRVGMTADEYEKLENAMSGGTGHTRR